MFRSYPNPIARFHSHCHKKKNPPKNEDENRHPICSFPCHLQGGWLIIYWFMTVATRDLDSSRPLDA